MTEEQRAELREHARKVAAEAPLLTEEEHHRLAVHLRSAVDTDAVRPTRLTRKDAA